MSHLNNARRKISALARYQPKWVIFNLLILFALMSVALAQADGPNQVALVVQHGDGEIITQCVEFSDSEITGLDVIDLAGLDYNIQADSMGVAVCRLDDEGCTYPQETCFCQCQGGDCIYWSYWHLNNGVWEYSQWGAEDYLVGHGAVEGWIWGLGSSGEATPPPVYTFDQICNAGPEEATATATTTNTPLPTATATATATATPSPSPTPTATPLPTHTPVSTGNNTPPPTPIIQNFTADRTTTNRGEGVLLRWNLSGADSAFLRYDNVQEGVISPGERLVRPEQTTVYTLVARKGASEAIKQLTITVVGPTNTATPTSTPNPTFTPDPNIGPEPDPRSGQANTATPTKTPTATPIPTDTPTPTVTPLPTITFTPMATQTPLSAALAPILPTPTRQLMTIATQSPSSAPAQTNSVQINNRNLLIAGGVLAFIGLLILAVIAILMVWLAIWWFALRKPG